MVFGENDNLKLVAKENLIFDCFFFETTDTAKQFKIRAPGGYLVADGACDDNTCHKVWNNGQESDEGIIWTIINAQVFKVNTVFIVINNDKCDKDVQYYRIRADINGYFWRTQQTPNDVNLRDMTGLNSQQRDAYRWKIVECE